MRLFIKIANIIVGIRKVIARPVYLILRFEIESGNST